MTRVAVIAGATGVGKTQLAVNLARRLGAAELVNADSRQVRRGLRVGTGAPTDAELSGIACHLLDMADPGEPFGLADWLHAARAVVQRLQASSVTPVVVGGTGLWIRALIDGFDLAGVPPDPDRRREREAVLAGGGVAPLAEELAARDPAAAASVDLRNPRRVIRALEILDARPGGVEQARGASAAMDASWIGLDVQPAVHRQWIEARVRGMFEADRIVVEARDALARGVSEQDLASCGIGYAEALSVLAGAATRDEAIAATVRRTVSYAKQQRTWFRAESRLHWLPAGELDEAALVDAAEGILRSA